MLVAVHHNACAVCTTREKAQWPQHVPAMVLHASTATPQLLSPSNKLHRCHPPHITVSCRAHRPNPNPRTNPRLSAMVNLQGHSSRLHSRIPHHKSQQSGMIPLLLQPSQPCSATVRQIDTTIHDCLMEEFDKLNDSAALLLTSTTDPCNTHPLQPSRMPTAQSQRVPPCPGPKQQWQRRLLDHHPACPSQHVRNQPRTVGP
jgi:hypothetical protein